MGILQRYVIGEVVRSFGLALLTMTAIFVLFMVAAQARDIGLSPGDIAHLVPYVIPSTLPYTIPVSLLFAATVVYGRLAGDNEIIAVKSAGLSVWTVLWPTVFLAVALSRVAALRERGLDSADALTTPRWFSSKTWRTCFTSCWRGTASSTTPSGRS